MGAERGGRVVDVEVGHELGLEVDEALLRQVSVALTLLDRSVLLRAEGDNLVEEGAVGRELLQLLVELLRELNRVRPEG